MANGPGAFLLDGRSQAFEPGDTVAMAIVRGGAHPRAGGTLCLAGDCGNCVAEVDGIAYVRTCLTPAHDELAVRRHPADAPPAWDPANRPVPPVRPGEVRRLETEVVVIGAGSTGRAAAAEVAGGRR